MKRFFFVLAVIAILLSAIVYSRWRDTAGFVSGMIEADEIRLGSRVGGRVKQVFVREGDSVAAGDKLVELEGFDLNEQEGIAAAELAVREAELKRVRTGLRPEEISQAQARLAQLEAKHALLVAGPRAEEIAAAENRLQASLAEQILARQEYERMSDLVESRSVSRSDFDAADQSLKRANANVAVRENELAILKAGAREQELARSAAEVEEARQALQIARQGYRAEDIESAAAASDAAKARLEVIRRQLQELVIESPVAGTVDALDLQPGDLVPPNAPVMTLLSQDTLFVRAYVPQPYLQASSGKKVKLTVDALPGEDFFGEIVFYSRQAEFTPGNVQTSDERARQVYRIRIALPRDSRLRPGMTANVWLGEPGQHANE